jgi:hypothetical protein
LLVLTLIWFGLALFTPLIQKQTDAALFLLGSKLPPPATDAHAQDRPAAAYA